MALSESAAKGSRLEALRDLRDILAVQIEATQSGRDLAALATRMQSVLAEIDELSGPAAGKAVDPIDELNARRRARGAVAATGRGRA